jgi:hypothetical protein
MHAGAYGVLGIGWIGLTIFLLISCKAGRLGVGLIKIL